MNIAYTVLNIDGVMCMLDMPCCVHRVLSTCCIGSYVHIMVLFSCCICSAMYIWCCVHHCTNGVVSMWCDGHVVHVVLCAGGVVYISCIC